MNHRERHLMNANRLANPYDARRPRRGTSRWAPRLARLRATHRRDVGASEPAPAPSRPTTGSARRRGRGQRGQAMPMAALGLFVMALAVIATLNLGQAVHQKIRLQNTADNAAYTLAAMEARAFNFIALTNRVQIVHYNTAMALQSYLSYAGYCLGMFGTVKDLLADLVLSLQTGCNFPPPANVPYCAAMAIFRVVSTVAQIIFNIAKIAYKVLHELAIPTIEALGLFNKYAVWQMQLVRALLLNAHLITGAYDFVLANDPDMTYTGKNQWFNILLSATLSSLEFRASFDRGAGLNPFIFDAVVFGFSDLRAYKPNPSKDEVKDAQRIMAEISNASRSHKDIYDRSLAGGMAVTSWGVATVMGDKMGSTKFVEDPNNRQNPAPKVKAIHSDPINYPLGETLASDDYLTIGAGFAIGGPAGVLLLPNGVKAIGDGIVAQEKGGKHYKYESKGGGAQGGAPTGMSSIVAIPPMQGTAQRTFQKNADQDHDWQGLAPYFKFKPIADRNKDFNQPSTWIFLNKHHSMFQSSKGSKGRPWHYKFTLTDLKDPKNPGKPISLDTTVGGKRNHVLPKLEGLNAISRGLVYYHRPGVWAEPPNLFNPFWRAKLAPVGAKLMNVFERFVSSNIQSSSDNQIMRMLVNIIRNFVSDVVFRAVTSIMTH